ncbi:MAG: hypothetical protein RR014_00375 [Bilophila sp.]
MKMSTYETLLQRIVPFVQPCMQVIVFDALQQIAVDFFTRTEIWQETLVETLYHGNTFVELSPDKGIALSRIRNLLLDGAQLDGGTDFYVEQAGSGLTIVFPFTMDTDRTVYAACAVRPARTATHIPDVFLEDWGDVLVFGTLAKLKSMSGHNVGWSDPEGAQINLALYEQGVTQARIRVVRRRDGRRLFVGSQRGIV